ncbi:hypothetical protein KIW84_065138 [Lathyrus oleraceus]|uniref:Uncharacterized protein n=1 Tax=Pisum sativum TaxID=3888 RepID=A0A9D4WG63_PEA|nr:hypothetical protein KIW84_065138 [Pisum sativum]
MADSERGTPSVLPMTPDTPGGPLFSSVRIDSLDHDSFAMARCNVCMPKGVRIPSVTLTQKVGAEFVGTFILIYVATAGPIVNNKYEGAHLNPSLTIAFAAFRHFPWAHVPAYIAAQVSASICACYALKVVYRPFLSGGVTLPTVTVGQAFATEFIITFILLFVATAVATDTRAVGEMAGIAVGATVIVNILISGPTSSGSMNPVRSLGPAVATGNYKNIWIYFVAPTLGALAGSGAYTLVKLRDEDDEAQQQPLPVRSFSH